MKRIRIVIVLLVLLLSGCQLAQPEIKQSEDRLIGMFLTTTYLDLFDAEAYLNDHLQNLNGGFLEADPTPYQGRLYAELVAETLTDDQGETVQHWDYKFPQLEGIGYYAARIERDGESYISTTSDSAIINGHTNLKYTDEGEEIHLAAEIWMAHTAGDITCYFNPVYQTADGQVYLTSGSGMATNGDNVPGSLYGHNLSQTTTIREGDQVTSHTCSVEISMGTTLLPERYTVLLMDAQHRLLSQTEYLPDAMPRELDTGAAAYLILETYSRNADGSPAVTWELWDSSKETMETLCSRLDGFMTQHTTSLLWK